MEGILESAAHTITLKPVSARPVHLIQGVKGCSAPGEARMIEIEKEKIAYVRHVSFIKSSVLRVITSAGLKKKWKFLKETELLRISARTSGRVPEQSGSVYWIARNNQNEY